VCEAHTEAIAALCDQAQQAGAEVARLREVTTNAHQELQRAGMFGRRCAAHGYQATLRKWEQARGRTEQDWDSAPWGAHDVTQWVERVSKQRTGQAPLKKHETRARLRPRQRLNCTPPENGNPSKHQATADCVSREKITQERADKLRQEQPYCSPIHQPSQHRGPSISR